MVNQFRVLTKATRSRPSTVAM